LGALKLCASEDTRWSAPGVDSGDGGASAGVAAGAAGGATSRVGGSLRIFGEANPGGRYGTESSGVETGEVGRTAGEGVDLDAGGSGFVTTGEGTGEASG
jgi:hypothetical protein